MYRRRIVALAATTLLALAACGDDKAATPTTVAPLDTVPAIPDSVVDGGNVEDTMVEDTMVEDTMVEDTMVEDTVDEGSALTGEVVPGAGIGTEFCDVNTELNETPSPLDDSEPTPEALNEYFSTTFAEMFARFAAAAPADMLDEVTVLGQGMDAFTEVLAANDWNIEGAFSDPALEAVMTNSDFEEAGSRVDSYCGMES